MIGMISVILAAIALIMIGYLAVGFAGYLAFPRTVSSNVLKTFPDTAIMQVAALSASKACLYASSQCCCIAWFLIKHVNKQWPWLVATRVIHRRVRRVIAGGQAHA